MTHNQKNTGEGVRPAGEMESQSTSLGDAATLADPSSTGFDNLHGIPQAAQAPTTSGQGNGGTIPPIIAPAAPQPDRWASIPQELRDRPQWVVAGADKVPLTASGQRASVTNPSTWCSFDIACQVAALRGFGIGYVLTADDPFSCVDLDVKDDTPTEYFERFQKIVNAFDSYTERSRSGVGLHVWVKGKIGKGVRRDGVEVYSQERFIICTGDVLHDKPIQHRQDMLGLLAAEMAGNTVTAPLPDAPEVESDEAILQRASSAANGAKFQALYSGDWQTIGHSDHSKADMSLLQMLAEYSRNNEQVKRLFLRSALGQREKATKRRDYLDRTLAQVRGHQANEANAEHGQRVAMELMAGELLKRMAPKRPARLTAAGGLRLVAASEIASRPPMKWLVRGVLPEKGIGAIFGQPGSGKSFLVLDLLAAVAGGFYWFGIPTKAAPVVYITLEGQAGMPQRIHAYRSRKGSLDRIAFIEQPIDLREADSLKELIDLIRDENMAGGVVCIDTLAASAPGMDENTSADMGQLIANLQDMQTELGGFVLVVHHSGKDETKGLRGWSGLNGALDCAIAVSRVSDNKKDINRRWEVSKSKDGSDGTANDFLLEQVQLGFDEDGHPITSCVISHTMQERVPASERDEEIDRFVWQWIYAQVEQGQRPSGRSLEGQRGQMAAQMKLTQPQLRDSIARLKAAGRVVAEPEKGNPWLRAVEGGADV